MDDDDYNKPRAPKDEIFDPDERVEARWGKRVFRLGTVLGHAWWKKRGVQVECDDGKVVWLPPENVRRLTLLERIADAARD